MYGVAGGGAGLGVDSAFMKHRRVVDIVGVPFDLCGPEPGSRLGPLAMRLVGLETGLQRLDYEIRGSDLCPIDSQVPIAAPERAGRSLPVYQALRDRVAGIDPAEAIPIVIGGDHSLALGSVAGALRRHGDGLAVLWIDAHMDLNTPGTTPSGNLHGMPLATLAHLPPGSSSAKQRDDVPWIDRLHGQWPELCAVAEPALRRGRVAWLGLRDVDEGEVKNQVDHMTGSLPLTMQDVDRLGVGGCLAEVDRWLRASGATALWVSFDVDVLDPVFAPGTGTAVRGGLTYREGHLVAEMLHALLGAPDCPYRLAGLDVVEVNPLNDRSNETARVATEWVLSFFGKSILGPRDPGRTERVG